MYKLLLPYYYCYFAISILQSTEFRCSIIFVSIILVVDSFGVLIVILYYSYYYYTTTTLILYTQMLMFVGLAIEDHDLFLVLPLYSS